MRYIKKKAAPEFFCTETENFDDQTLWKELHCKKALRQYLQAEQQYLCAYCEGKLDESNTHIEHIEPQEKNPQRRFDYNNLIASCNGGEACCSENEKSSYAKLDIRSCGHRKSNDYTPDLFLNPVTVTEIERYFSYDSHDAAIQASSYSTAQAQYMIDLLNLDNAYLRNSRYNARVALMRAIKRSGITPKSALDKLLHHPRPFISFLRACFANTT